jgi:hypothetical protein
VEGIAVLGLRDYSRKGRRGGQLALPALPNAQPDGLTVAAPMSEIAPDLRLVFPAVSTPAGPS